MSVVVFYFTLAIIGFVASLVLVALSVWYKTVDYSGAPAAATSSKAPNARHLPSIDLVGASKERIEKQA